MVEIVGYSVDVYRRSPEGTLGRPLGRAIIAGRESTEPVEFDTASGVGSVRLLRWGKRRGQSIAELNLPGIGIRRLEANRTTWVGFQDLRLPIGGQVGIHVLPIRDFGR